MTTPLGEGSPNFPIRPSRLMRLRRPLAIFSAANGDCGGCRGELSRLASPTYVRGGHGALWVPSPHQAEVLLAAGPVTSELAEPLRAAYAALIAPKWVIALGDCACGVGAICEQGPESTSNGDANELFAVEAIIPVTAKIAGCPPTPSAIWDALFALASQ